MLRPFPGSLAPQRESIHVLSRGFPWMSVEMEMGEEVLTPKPSSRSRILALPNFCWLSQEIYIGETLTFSQELQALY